MAHACHGTYMYEDKRTCESRRHSVCIAYARASARLFMTQHALLPRDMLSTICYNQESDERAALGELRATKWSPDKTLRSRTAHKRITHGGCTWKDDEYRCTYPIKPLSPAAGYLRSGPTTPSPTSQITRGGTSPRCEFRSTLFKYEPPSPARMDTKVQACALTRGVVA